MTRPGGKSRFSPWDCDKTSGRGPYSGCRNIDGTWDDTERSRRGCTRADLDPVQWDVDARRIVHIGAWVGRHHLPGVREIGGLRCDPEHPPEDPDDGCPGGWRLNRFTMSIDPYLRMRAGDGMRVSNPIFDSCDHPLIWQWVRCFEQEQERCENHQARILASE